MCVGDCETLSGHNVLVLLVGPDDKPRLCVHVLACCRRVVESGGLH